jgi:hypothetical protein
MEALVPTNQTITMVISLAFLHVEEVWLVELFIGWFQGGACKLLGLSKRMGWMDW